MNLFQHAFFCDESLTIKSQKCCTTFLTVLPRTQENQLMEASQEEDVDCLPCEDYISEAGEGGGSLRRNY